MTDDAFELLKDIADEGSLNLAQMQAMYEDRAAVVLALAELLKAGLIRSGDCAAGCFHSEV
jgi:hypothetical protein